MKKQNHLAALATAADEAKREKFPSVPAYAVPRSKYSDATANDLTRAILDFINLQAGATAWRTSNAPTYDAKRKIWRAGNVLKGVSDIAAIRDGRTWQIEIKIGKDKISPAQKAFAERTEKAGGRFVVARSFAEFVQIWSDAGPYRFESEAVGERWFSVLAVAEGLEAFGMA